MNKTKKQLEIEYKAMLEENKAMQEKLQIAQSKVKEKKEFSEVFVTSDSERKLMKYSSLNEMKRYAEDNFLAELQSLVTTNDKKLNSKEFHAIINKCVKAFI